MTDSEVEEVYKTAPLNADLVRVEAARSSDGGETLSWVAPDLHDNIYGRRSDLRGQAIRYSSNPYDYWQMSVTEPLWIDPLTMKPAIPLQKNQIFFRSSNNYSTQP